MSTTGQGRRRGAGVATAALLSAALLTACAGAASDQDATTGPTTATATPSEDVTSPAASPSASEDGSPQAATPDDTPTAGTTVIAAPTSGAVLDGPTVQVSGEATAFEATLRWEVVPAGTDDDAAPVATDFTQAGANGEVGPFAFSVDLPAGTWTIHVWEPDMGEGDDDSGRCNEATVTVTVR